MVFDDVVERDPVGGGQDDFIALVDESRHGVENDVLGADAGDALVGRVCGTEVLRMPVADGFLELGDAAGGGVLGEVFIQGADGGLLDVVGRGEVGLTGAEGYDVNSFGFELGGLGGYGHGGGFADVRNSVRQFHAA